MSRFINADAFEVFEYELVGGSSEYREGFDDGVEYVLGRIDNVPTADVVSKGKYDELNVRYHMLLESAKILSDAVREYERREDERSD